MHTDSASAPSSTTWLRRARMAVAGAALAALTLGGAACGSPDTSPADDQAGSTWSFTWGGDDDGGDDRGPSWGGGKGGPGAGTYGSTWS